LELNAIGKPSFERKLIIQPLNYNPGLNSFKKDPE